LRIVDLEKKSKIKKKKNPKGHPKNASKKLSLYPLKFDEVLRDILSVRPEKK